MSTATLQSQVELDGRLLALAGALTVVGGMLWIAGLSIGAATVLRAGQQWVRELDKPPVELARAKWRQALSAKAAASDAWKNGSSPSRSGTRRTGGW